MGIMDVLEELIGPEYEESLEESAGTELTLTRTPEEEPQPEPPEYADIPLPEPEEQKRDGRSARNGSCSS